MPEIRSAAFSPLFLGSRRVAFMCHCSRSRFAGYLGALPVTELEDILERGPLPLVTTCANCNTAYEHSRSDIERLLRRARGRQTGEGVDRRD